MTMSATNNEADLEYWRDWDEKGVMGLHIFGFPGSGKSNLANLLLSHCLLQGDMGLMRGSMNCEWRHFTLYDFPIKILVPECLEIECLNFDIKNFNCVPFNPDEFEIIDHLVPGELLVIYDAAFSLPSRGWFWADIFKQLVNRTEKYDVPVTFLEHEAGVLFPEIALSESKKAQNHWKAVNQICELFVDFRKNLIRPILISQLASEINHRLRDKCLYTVIKKGIAGKRYPQQVREEAPWQRVDQYIVCIGKEIYTRYNDAEKFHEITKMWKAVPDREIELKSLEQETKPSRAKTIIINLIKDDYTNKEIAKFAECQPPYISQIRREVEKTRISK